MVLLPVIVVVVCRCCCCSVMSLTICRCPGYVDVSSSEHVWPRYDATTNRAPTGEFISCPCYVFCRLKASGL